MSKKRNTVNLEHDWYSGGLPPNIIVDESVHIDTAYSFLLYRSKLTEGMTVGKESSIYKGCMFDVGVNGHVSIGDYSLLHGIWMICDSQISIGNYALISWNVVFMDTYRVTKNPVQRRKELMRVPFNSSRRADMKLPGKPIEIEDNVWIGFDSCILPGVTIGEGSIIGARSVVFDNVPPYTIMAGNPARFIRKISKQENGVAL